MSKPIPHLSIALLPLVVLFLTSCGGAQIEPSATPVFDSPTETIIQSTSTPDQVPSNTETPLPTPIPSPRADVPLSNEGPWWVFKTEETLWAVNPDGSGLRKLVTHQNIVSDLRDGLAPRGGHLAYFTGTGLDNIQGLTLNILSLPSGESQIITPLTSPEIEAALETDQRDQAIEAALALTWTKSLDWSPDSRRLAFMGVMEGPTSDLYIYSLDDENITRLSDGPTQAIRPIWGPLGDYILHAGVRSMGSGGGMGMVGFWAARDDGSEFKSLFDPSGSGDEIVVGWIDPETFVVFTWTISGNERLRSVNIETGETRILFQGCFDEELALNEQTGAVLLAVGEFEAECIPGILQGLYLVPTAGGHALRVVEDEAFYIRWSEEVDLFLALTEYGVLAVSTTGEFIDLDVPEGASWFPVVAPDTKQLAWTGEGGVWIGSLLGSIDHPPSQIFSERAGEAAWGPQGEHLLFVSGGALYVAHSPDFIPVLVDEGVISGGIEAVWVSP